ncbi:MAG TPA: hypothetical protein VFP11_09375, partial [Candidatus Angelobacter sp.]|nr:hypothetical protein [Candidatus Angelobacter sp.]
LKINLYVAFGLALQADVTHGRKPSLRLAIVFKPPIFHRLMNALAYVVQDNPRFFIARHGKPDVVRTTIDGQVRAAAGIAHIAEIAQFSF